MTKKQASWALTAAMAIGILIGYLFGSTANDEPVQQPATYEQPAEETYEQQLIECVQEHQTLYDVPRNQSTAICVNYLQGAN